jgi:hypothetical protein
MARFEREANVARSTLGISSRFTGKNRALIMELAENESPKGPMLFEEAWNIALQVAEALP